MKDTNDFYYSRFLFDLQVKGADIGNLQWDDLYQHHQFVWRLFDRKDTATQECGDFLYRIDYFVDTPVIHVLSRFEPLAKIARWQVNCQPWQPAIKEGALFQFSLRANPVVALEGKRHDVFMHAKKQYQENDPEPLTHRMYEAGLQYLTKRADSLGVEFVGETLEFGNKQTQVGCKPGEEAAPITITTVDYKGVLRVKDRNRFAEKAALGIGRAKRFGCGLMLLNKIA